MVSFLFVYSFEFGVKQPHHLRSLQPQHLNEVNFLECPQKLTVCPSHRHKEWVGDRHPASF